MHNVKICSKCGKNLPATKEFFYKHNQKKDGLRPDCKDCTKKTQSNYYIENKEDVIKRVKRYADDNKGIISERAQKYYQENKEQIKEKSNQWYEERGKYLYIKNKKYIAKRNARWKKENKSKVNGYTNKRRTKLRNGNATLTPRQWENKKREFNNSCAYCGITEETHRKEYKTELHQDHFIPLSKGGDYTHNNIIPSCGSCNPSKGDKNFFEWYPTYKHYSKDRESFILEYLGYDNKNIQQLSIL